MAACQPGSVVAISTGAARWTLTLIRSIDDESGDVTGQYLSASKADRGKPLKQWRFRPRYEDPTDTRLPKRGLLLTNAQLKRINNGRPEADQLLDDLTDFSLGDVLATGLTLGKYGKLRKSAVNVLASSGLRRQRYSGY